MNSLRPVLLLILALLAFSVHAERPKIGLALGGGGAKGTAHIAVLEALDTLDELRLETGRQTVPDVTAIREAFEQLRSDAGNTSLSEAR